jgi:Fe-S-cluster containining protein
MELKVLENDRQEPATKRPWYGGGLHFTCSQCGNCCTGAPGYVWISSREIKRLAKHLKLTTSEVLHRYCRSVGTRFSLKENRNERGEYDCIFLKEEKIKGAGGIVHTRRTCTVYPVRPLQCRTWPFWEGNLRTPDAWRESSMRCHGMNNGPRVFTQEQIEALRDATDWPQNPPTSDHKS